MKNIKLSQRQKNIIKMLPSKKELPITVNNIANSLDLSSRTVQRDLVDIEKFLEENYFELIKKPGIGLIMNESKEELSYLYELLDMIDSHKRFDREKRVNFILSRLLSSNQAIKYQAFTMYLNISEKTLLDDLSNIEEWLSSYDIDLLRKKGEGISIKGAENDIRKAQADLIYQNLDEDSRLELLRDINEQEKLNLINENNILNLIDREIINRTRLALNEAFNSLNISISDNSYIGLVVHISLAIERLKLDEEIEINPVIKEDIESTQEYIYAQKIVVYLEKEFKIKFPVTETSYIAMHIKGANIIAKGQDLPNMDDILQAHIISKALIDKMEEVFALVLDDDKRLENDLIAHLSPALTRLKHDLNIRNPILKEIKTNYSEIYDNLTAIVPEVLDKYCKLDNDQRIPEDEIGYIAIHFITSIERRIIERTNINIVTVCPTGYGTSRLLATYLSNNIKNINIIGNASIMDLSKKYLKDNNIDLIISTVNLDNIIPIKDEFDTPLIEVSAIVSENDLSLINREINKISRNKYYNKDLYEKVNQKPETSTLQVPDPMDTINDLKFAQYIYWTCIQLYNLQKHVCFFDIDLEDNLEKKVSELISDGEKEALIIENALTKRNQISSTFFDEFKLHLLHASCLIEHPKLSFGRLNNKCELVIVMLTTIDKPKEINDLFSNISSLIIEDENFINLLREYRIDELNNIVNDEIVKIINKRIQRRKNDES